MSRGDRLKQDTLLRSFQDDIMLCERVEHDLDVVRGLHRRILGRDLLISKTMDQDLALADSMRRRHLAGDYRHTKSEKDALKAIAQFNIDVNCLLRGQPSVKLTWKD